MPSLAMAMPTLHALPPVVRVIDSVIARPPGGGGWRRSMGAAMRSATIRPKMAASKLPERAAREVGSG
jgi:hypothetical protein